MREREQEKIIEGEMHVQMTTRGPNARDTENGIANTAASAS